MEKSVFQFRLRNVCYLSKNKEQQPPHHMKITAQKAYIDKVKTRF